MRAAANRNLFKSLTLLTLLSILVSCGSTSEKANISKPGELVLIRSDYKEGEITKLCDAELKAIEEKLKKVETTAPEARNLDNTLHVMERAISDLYFNTDPLVFMASVSTNEKHNPEATQCEEKRGQYIVGVFGRKALFQSFKDLNPRTTDEARLLLKSKESFERAGILLAEDKLAKLTELKRELTKKETQFSNNLNQDNTTVSFTKDELEGVTDDFLARLKKDEKGNLIATTKSTDYVSVMENAKKAESRKKMMAAYLTRGGTKNIELLQSAVELRQDIAEILGYKNWADYQTVNRTARDKKTVDDFLKNLRTKLSKRYKMDSAQLLKFKKELDPQAKKVDPWDISYLSYQLKKRDYALDEEKIREYFPADTVVKGVFAVYSDLLGVKYEQIKNANVWATGVQLFSVTDTASGRHIGYFFADFFPRKGKYGHAAAFSLVSGRREENGSYNKPISAIVSNFTPPVEGKPSLMTHDEVETLFHEFGHIMHQVLTQAPYASLSGTSVPWDFVEAPSQMLENWAWDPQVMKSISGHYKNPQEKLPDAMIAQMIKARHFQEGTTYARQLLYSIYDLSLHTGDRKADVLKNFYTLYKDILDMDSLEGSLFPAGFGHLMGGYDAGYYGYLWSRVFAQDMFSNFEKKGLLDAETGKRYRTEILEPGNMRDAMESLKVFLARKPSSEAFFKSLGIK